LNDCRRLQMAVISLDKSYILGLLVVTVHVRPHNLLSDVCLCGALFIMTLQHRRLVLCVTCRLSYLEPVAFRHHHKGPQLHLYTVQRRKGESAPISRRRRGPAVGKSPHPLRRLPRSATTGTPSACPSRVAAVKPAKTRLCSIPISETPTLTQVRVPILDHGYIVWNFPGNDN
jgi:hypothetical protein